MKHSFMIKKAIGISGVLAIESAWYSHASKTDTNSKGVQIDLLFDRNDKVISVCEMKCYNREFEINKKYAEELRKKTDVFREKTKTTKSIFLVMVTTRGVKKNQYYSQLVDNEVTLNDLF